MTKTTIKCPSCFKRHARITRAGFIGLHIAINKQGKRSFKICIASWQISWWTPKVRLIGGPKNGSIISVKAVDDKIIIPTIGFSREHCIYEIESTAVHSKDKELIGIYKEN